MNVWLKVITLWHMAWICRLRVDYSLIKLNDDDDDDDDDDYDDDDGVDDDDDDDDDVDDDNDDYDVDGNIHCCRAYVHSTGCSMSLRRLFKGPQ